MSAKLNVAILGTGNIGIDLLLKVRRSDSLECRLFAGRNLASPGMLRANHLGVPVSAKGVRAVLEQRQDFDLVFDATSAQDHMVHAPLFREAGLLTIDLTPAQVGKMCVPAVNLDECLDEQNVNMVSCGGQASVPLAFAISQANENVEYIETISSISSRSAGPATRINLDEYLGTTETALKRFSSAARTKAILNLNPAQPSIHMQTTVLARITNPDLERTRQSVFGMVQRLRRYIPGYHLVLEPMMENGRLAIMIRVDGVGDYLPEYAGNLDIINCAAIAMAEAYAKKRNAHV